MSNDTYQKKPVSIYECCNSCDQPNDEDSLPWCHCPKKNAENKRRFSGPGGTDRMLEAVRELGKGK